MLPRHIQPQLQALLSHFPCVVLTGVRQCGKTTLLRTLGPEWQHFDMENSADRQQLLADPDLFLRLHNDKLAIDEAQLAPTLFSALRVEIKLNQQGDKRALRSLSEFVQAHNCPLGLLVNNDERPRWLDERILSIPAACL